MRPGANAGINAFTTDVAAPSNGASMRPGANAGINVHAGAEYQTTDGALQ